MYIVTYIYISNIKCVYIESISASTIQGLLRTHIHTMLQGSLWTMCQMYLFKSSPKRPSLATQTHTHTNYVGQPTKFKSNVSAFSLVFSGDKSCQDLRHQTFLSDRFPSATKRLKVVRICIGLRLLVKASARGNLANNVGSLSCSGVQSRIVQQMKH